MPQYLFNAILHFRETLPHFVLVLLFYATAFLFGYLLVKRLRLPSTLNSLTRTLLALLLGFLILAEGVFILGIAHLLFKPVVVGFWGAILLIGLLDNRKELGIWRDKLATLDLTKLIKPSSLTSMAIFFVIGISLYLTLKGTLPDDGFDSNWYHLTEPFLYLRQHSLEVIPGGVLSYSTMPQMVEMLYLILLSVGNSITTSLFGVGAYFMLVILVYQLGLQLLRKKELAYLATAIMAGMPLVVDQATVAYIDIFLVVVQLAALALFVKLLQNDINDKQFGITFFLIGILTGFALAIKLLAGMFALLLGLMIVVYLVSSLKQVRWTRKIRYLLAFVLPALLIFAPWALRSYLATGNPVSPQLNSIFLGEASSLVNNIEYAAFLAENPITKIYRIVFWLPHKLKAGWPLFFLLPLFFFLSPKKKAVRYLLGYIALFALIWYFIPPHVHRYLMPTFPLIVVLGVQGLENLSRKRDWIATCLGLILLAVNFLQFADYYHRKQAFFYYLPYAVGFKTTTDFKNSRFVQEPYMFYDYDGSVKAIVRDGRLLTFGIPLLYPTLEEFEAYDATFSGLDLGAIKNSTDLRNAMLGNNFRYALTIRAELPVIFEEIMHRKLETGDWWQNFNLVKQDLEGSGYYLYQIK